MVSLTKLGGGINEQEVSNMVDEGLIDELKFDEWLDSIEYFELTRGR